MGINTLDRLVRDLGAAAGADKPPIITAIDRRTVWAWLPFGRRVPAPDPEVLATAVPLDGGARVAIGLPGSGVDGFKRSHEQATAAYSVACRPGYTAATCGELRRPRRRCGFTSVREHRFDEVMGLGGAWPVGGRYALCCILADDVECVLCTW